jgi:hypothetical protein
VGDEYSILQGDSQMTNEDIRHVRSVMSTPKNKNKTNRLVSTSRKDSLNRKKGQQRKKKEK